MKVKINKEEAKEKINSFFQRENFTAEEMRKIKRLAMKFRIPLKEKRKLFCKKCLNKLKGKTRISKAHKITICSFCGYKNRFKMKQV